MVKDNVLTVEIETLDKAFENWISDFLAYPDKYSEHEPCGVRYTSHLIKMIDDIESEQ